MPIKVRVGLMTEKETTMRALIGGLCLLMIATGLKAEEGRRTKQDRHETPYSNSAVARQRETREAVRQVDRDRRARETREYDYQRRAREGRN